jgi:hypothetical protein
MRIGKIKIKWIFFFLEWSWELNNELIVLKRGIAIDQHLSDWFQLYKIVGEQITTMNKRGCLEFPRLLQTSKIIG